MSYCSNKGCRCYTEEVCPDCDGDIEDLKDEILRKDERIKELEDCLKESITNLDNVLKILKGKK